MITSNDLRKICILKPWHTGSNKRLKNTFTCIMWRVIGIKRRSNPKIIAERSFAAAGCSVSFLYILNRPV